MQLMFYKLVLWSIDCNYVLTGPSSRALARVRVLGDIDLIRNNIIADCFNLSFCNVTVGNVYANLEIILIYIL